MVNIFQKKVLILAIYAGEIMMKNGAEVYRVEDTITRICKACRMDHVEIFATPTGIFVSLDNGGEDDDPLTYVKRIDGIETDLNKISKINHFSREFTTTDLSVDDAMDQLHEIDESKPYPVPLRLLGAALVASCFSLISAVARSISPLHSAWGCSPMLFPGSWENSISISSYDASAAAQELLFWHCSCPPGSAGQPISR